MQPPIVVTGLPKQGLTLIQNLLTSHPNVRILGTDALNWHDILNFPAVLTKDSSLCSVEGSKILYQRFVHDFLNGGNYSNLRRKWGVKVGWLHMPKMSAPFNDLFPNARWVICIRNPFHSYKTFMEATDVDFAFSTWASAWIQSLTFGKETGGFVVKTDELGEMGFEDRKKVVDNIFFRIGEMPTYKVYDFCSEWKIFGKSPKKREWELKSEEIAAVLEANPLFAKTVDGLGYVP